jgi:hypothetical protein
MKNPSLPTDKKKLDLPPANNLIPKNFDIFHQATDEQVLPLLLK